MKRFCLFVVFSLLFGFSTIPAVSDSWFVSGLVALHFGEYAEVVSEKAVGGSAGISRSLVDDGWLALRLEAGYRHHFLGDNAGAGYIGSLHYIMGIEIPFVANDLPFLEFEKDTIITRLSFRPHVGLGDMVHYVAPEGDAGEDDSFIDRLFYDRFLEFAIEVSYLVGDNNWRVFLAPKYWMQQNGGRLLNLAIGLRL